MSAKRPPEGYGETATCHNCRWGIQPYRHDPTTFCWHGLSSPPPKRDAYPYRPDGHDQWDAAWDAWRNKVDPSFDRLCLVEAYCKCSKWEEEK